MLTHGDGGALQRLGRQMDFPLSLCLGSARSMHSLYLLSVWVHILAATVWIGGMLFLVLVVVPWLRKGTRSDAAVLLRETGERFRNVGWICFVVLLITFRRSQRVSDSRR